MSNYNFKEFFPQSKICYRNKEKYYDYETSEELWKRISKELKEYKVINFEEYSIAHNGQIGYRAYYIIPPINVESDTNEKN